MIDVSFSPWETGRGRRIRRRRRVYTLVAVVAIAGLAAAVSVRACTRPHMCSSRLEKIGGECIGVTDHHSFVSGGQGKDALATVRSAIEKENAWVDRQHKKAVTVAFLGPLSNTDPHGIAGGVTHEIEGAYTAQYRINHDPLFNEKRLVKLMLANEGQGERYWRKAVHWLEEMTGDERAPLVAVVGLVLSKDETYRAAQELADHHIPMVGDIITADQLDGRRVEWLTRVATPNDDQVHAIATYIRRYRHELHSAVMLTDRNGGDMYNRSLRTDYEKYLGDYWQRSGRADDQFVSTGNVVRDLQGAVHDLCGPSRADMVLFAGRANALDMFIKELNEFQTLQGQACKAKPLTIVTGSDAEELSGGSSKPADRTGAPRSRYTILFTPLADPNVLKVTNPQPFAAFLSAFTRNVPGDPPKTGFPVTDLYDSWAIKAHDAMMTAATAINTTSSDPPKPEDILVALRQMQVSGHVDGAVTVTGLTADGNPKTIGPLAVMQLNR